FFDKDVIEWKKDCELHNFYKTLLHLRSTHTALRAGDDNAASYRLKTTDGRVYSFLRTNGNDEILVALNLSADPVSFNITDDKISGDYKNVFSGETSFINKENALFLSAWDYKVFEK